MSEKSELLLTKIYEGTGIKLTEKMIGDFEKQTAKYNDIEYPFYPEIIKVDDDSFIIRNRYLKPDKFLATFISTTDNEVLVYTIPSSGYGSYNNFRCLVHTIAEDDNWTVYITPSGSAARNGKTIVPFVSHDQLEEFMSISSEDRSRMVEEILGEIDGVDITQYFPVKEETEKTLSRAEITELREDSFKFASGSKDIDLAISGSVFAIKTESASSITGYKVEKMEDNLKITPFSAGILSTDDLKKLNRVMVFVDGSEKIGLPLKANGIFGASFKITWKYENGIPTGFKSHTSLVSALKEICPDLLDAAIKSVPESNVVSMYAQLEVGLLEQFERKFSKTLARSEKIENIYDETLAAFFGNN